MTNSESISTVPKSIDSSDNRITNVDFQATDLQAIERHPQVGFDPEKLVPSQTYVECGVEKLTALCHAVGLTDKLPQIVEIFQALTASWGDRRVGETSTWASDVSDDRAPFEFSLALDPDKVELRVLVEAQGSDPNLQSNWQAGRDLNQHLAQHYNVSLDRFEQIADLFAPTNPAAKFSMWHAVCFYPDKEPSFKLYLNPQAQAPSRSAAVVEESLVRLGFTHAWPTLAETAAQRGPDRDQFVYFSLDLAAHDKARVKVYIRHHDATPAELEAALSAARNYIPGDAIEFCQAMAPGQASFSAKPAITCFSLIEGDDYTPSSGTLYLPVSNYATNDRVVSDRLELYFSQRSLPVSVYRATIQALTARLLERGVGLHSYISLRRERQQQQRISIYLNPEVNVIQPPSTIAVKKPLQTQTSLEEMLLSYERNTVAHHPFLQRLQREPVNLTHIWVLFMNIREGVVTDFTRRLANIVGRIDDERIRCILAKQLNDELGNGDINRIHRKLFDRLMNAIEPWKLKSFEEKMLAPGKAFSQRLEEIYLDSNPYVGVGAAMVMEIHGEQFDTCLGNEFRKTTVDRTEIAWLTLHEELEVDHADESFVLAHFVGDSAAGVAGARQGAEQTYLASCKFLDELYRICFVNHVE